jgi:Cytochrome c7 and related cytochrome c
MSTGAESAPPLFSRRANRIMRAGLLFAAALVVGVPLLLMGWLRTPAARSQHAAVVQPVPFDHLLHVSALRIDCRYCHDLVERAPVAGVPPTDRCIACHNWVTLNGPLMQQVRRSAASGRPIPWVRVNSLPDFVFFNHAVHVNKGVGCETCHGRVDTMSRIEQTAPLTMSWCLDCHREPERYLRPVEAMTAMGWTPNRPQLELGRELVQRYHVRQLTYCTTCHR